MAFTYLIHTSYVAYFSMFPYDYIKCYPLVKPDGKSFRNNSSEERFINLCGI